MRAAVGAALDLIGPRARRRYVLVVLAQMATSFLDLLGVLLVGATVVFAYSVPAGAETPASVQALVDALGLQDVPMTTLAIACAVTAAVLLLAKSAISAALFHRIFRFLAARQAEVSSRLARNWFARDVHEVNRQSDVAIEHALVASAYAATTGLLGSAAVVLSELSLLVVLSAALLLIDPIAALLAAGCFVIVAVVVHRALSGWATRIGSEVNTHTVHARAEVRTAMDAFRELRTNRRLGFPLAAFGRDVRVLSQGRADQLFINNVPRLAYEAALVAGAIVLVGWRFLTGDPAGALAFLAVFLTATARLLPSMVRLQGQLVLIRSSAALGAPTFAMARAEAAESRAPDTGFDDLGREVPSDTTYPGFVPSIEARHLTVTHPQVLEPTLVDVSLAVDPGDSLVVVGMTGSGKSTLVDVLLGMTEPDAGIVLISGVSPLEAQRRWPGAIAYMPQQSVIVAGSVRDNVALALPRESVDDDAVWHALELAHLADDVRDKGGLDHEVGLGGRHLSGGQRQRLGIARALYSRPRLLVLDEATSALDGTTEALIGAVLDALRGEVTVVAVAHRPSTIERAGRVAVVSGGRLGFFGSPSEYLAARP